jgi:TolB-like protein/class 3 adenylate cyclase/Flp pilus assembly protein TadD
MSAESMPELELQIAHLLLVDIVGYSNLLVNEQIEMMQELNRVVRTAECFRAAEAKDKLIRLPTGDGMALLFFENLEQPARCALEIAEKLRGSASLRLRMGIHSGPVNQVADVNDRVNIAGAGINIAQRVLDCGDAGHILVSKHVADDLTHYRHWQPYLHDLGECEVKHGLQLHLFNLCKEGAGNQATPERLKRRMPWKSTAPVHPIASVRWPKLAMLFALCLALAALAFSLAILLRPRVSVKPAANGAPVAVSEKSIAVLPFENLSDDKQNAYFADGVQDEILTNLAKVADLKVISRTSVMQYRNRSERNIRAIADALGVAHILEGTVQRAGGRVRVSAQLIDARSDAHIWADHYDRDVADVFAIENELAEKIVGELKSKISPGEKAAIEEKPTADLAAYDVYLRGRALVEGAVFSSGNELFEAIRFLEDAVNRDPSFALAYYQLAHAHDQLYVRAIDRTPERLKLAETAIQSLRRLRPDSGEAHLAQAKHLYWGYLDYEHARKELAAARQALPNEPLVFLLLGYIDRRQGRWDDSLKNMQQAISLDPSGPQTPFMLEQISRTYEILRRYTEQGAALDRALALSPQSPSLRLNRANVDLVARAEFQPYKNVIRSLVADELRSSEVASQWLEVSKFERNWDEAARALSVMPPDGCREEAFPFPRAWCEGLVAHFRGDEQHAHSAFVAARSEVEKIVEKQPDNAPAVCVLGVIDAALGNKREGIREAKRAAELLPVAKDSINGAYVIKHVAITYAFAGKTDAAIAELAKAVKIPGYLSYGELRLDPIWDPLRKDPRFEKIVTSLAPK